MRIEDDILIAKTYNDLFIDLDDEYMDMDFYKYNYIKTKYKPNYMKPGKYIGLYREGWEKVGYFYVSSLMGLKPVHTFPRYTRYFELLEFGFLNNNIEEVKFLIDYLIYYCRTMAGTFLKIKTTENDFNPFYELIKKYPHTSDAKYLYIDLDPIEYEFTKHLVSYEGDQLTIKDLYHLYSIGFEVYKDSCIMNLQNDEIIKIDRKTANIIYPNRFINIPNKYLKLNKNSYNLISYISFEKYNLLNKTIQMDYRLPGYDYELIKIDNKLLSFVNFKDIDACTTREDFPYFAFEAYVNNGFTSLHIITNAKFDFKHYYPRHRLQFVYLPKYCGEETEKSLIQRIREQLAD